MIVSFGDRAAEDLYHNRFTSRVRRFPRDIVPSSLIKMDYLEAAHNLRDLRIPPGNHLEKLRGELKGYHSIRINDQWRLVFLWQNDGAHEVRLEDYH